jgi:hypothetical protein
MSADEIDDEDGLDEEEEELDEVDDEDKLDEADEELEDKKGKLKFRG